MGFDRDSARAGQGSSGGGDAAVGRAPGKQTRVAALAQARSPAQLRTAMAADPTLAADITAYFAEGNEDPDFNALLGRTFPGMAADKAIAEKGAAQTKAADDPFGMHLIGAKSGDVAEKAGTGAGATLPAARSGNKPLTLGTYKWNLAPVDTSSPQMDAEFKPDESKVEAKNVSFVQTVLNQVGGKKIYARGTTAHPDKEKATFEPYEESTKKTRVDHHPWTENDPFYGAEWDQGAKNWKAEATPGSVVGSSQKGVSSTAAKMSDPPNVDAVAREGQGTVTTEFETVAVVLETRQPLGALKWGLKIEDRADAPLELTGATDADCTDAPSAEWGAALDKFYEAKFETILDEFDIAKHDLKPDHKTKLDAVATKMKANVALNAQLGGACDHTGDEAFNQALSLKRAEAARDYLVSKGIDAGRLTVESYSFDWARVAADRGTSEGKNRRVQVWLR